MTRTKRGSIARKRRTKSTSSFRGARSNRTRTILQQRIKALVSSQQDRDRKKRDFRSLWISRINAIIGQNKEKIYYSNLMYNLYTNQLLLNRKIVSQIAILKGNCLFIISNDIIHFFNKNSPETELREGGRIKEICMIK
uniref:50S ribosomal protein L20 n=3 Tax=Lathyrus TaxID=3853 RepID=A0A2S1CEN9_PEA|nr:ribosomal protein L20 [Pisum fulvum]YP_009488133.1 ribosomal protein L20 [Pisum abyssinicum]YP_009514091.1 ribosomal protein L20 [Pisum sativum subsp. elatius]AUM82267.1 ribosomal protein L20 [Pisum fulvum]AUM82344.1 ribosomal protein L20 [Pisum fulvum]AWD26627.1 ribosomal protein L20 [Pisum sativum subsp. elatius]AWD26701.1 ribosomal protein L20 [Pisum sativum subsp. elatius]AWD26849.1 ribosomal protein L20 [Pisum abyssinicum]